MVNLHEPSILIDWIELIEALHGFAPIYTDLLSCIVRQHGVQKRFFTSSRWPVQRVAKPWQFNLAVGMMFLVWPKSPTQTTGRRPRILVLEWWRFDQWNERIFIWTSIGHPSMSILPTWHFRSTRSMQTCDISTRQVLVFCTIRYTALWSDEMTRGRQGWQWNAMDDTV